MPITLDGTAGITSPNDTTGNQSYTGTLTGGTGVVNLGSGQFVKDASGNVGIGTSSPAAGFRLHAVNAGGANVIASTSSDASGVTTYMQANGSVSGVFGTLTNHPQVFLTNNAERMRIDSSGNVVIGTTASLASYKTTIQHTSGELLGLNASSGTLTRIAFGNADASFGTTQIIANSTALAFITNAAERMRIDSSGNLLVGTTLANNNNSNSVAINVQNGNQYNNHISGTASGVGYIQFALAGTVIGTITQNGTTNVAYNTSSDYRLKENIAPMTGALNVVSKLKPVTYKWKVDGSDGQGFIAHELQAVVPDCVTGEKDAVDKEGKPVYQGIDTSFLVATLTAAIQEQQALIQNLTTRLNALEEN